MSSTGDEGWNFFGSDTDSVTIPYTAYTANGGSPQIAVSVDGGPVRNYTIDTGSLGLVVPMEDVPDTLDYLSGTPGRIGYGSSGNSYSGYWITTSISLTDADGTTLKDSSGRALAEELPVLVVTQSYHDGVALSGDQGAPTQLGVGFSRPVADANGVPLTLANNAFLNLSGEADGTMRPGYIIGQTSVTIGLTAANADAGWAFSKLTPRIDGSTGVGGAADWNNAAAVVTVSGQTSTGSELVDTGLSHAELGWPDAPAGGTALPAGTNVSTDLLGIGDDSVSYRYTLGDGQPQTPVRGTSTGTATFTNTTDTLLNGLDYLYDAVGGYVGFRLNAGGGNAGGSFTQEVAIGGTVVLPDGFSSTLPTVLRDATTFSETGTATFAAAFSGASPLTLTGGGSFLFSGGGSVSGGLTVRNGSLQIKKTLSSGDATVSGSVTLTATVGGNAERWTITGALDVSGGVVTVGKAAELDASGGVTVEKGGSLLLAQGAVVSGSVRLDDGFLYTQDDAADAAGVSLSGAVTVGGTSDTFDLGLHDALTLSGTIAGGTTNGLDITGNGLLALNGQNSFAGGVLIGRSAELVLGSVTAAGTGPIRFVAAQSSTDPLSETVAGVIGGTAAVLGALDLSQSGFGLGNGIDITDLAPKTTANLADKQITTAYDAGTGVLSVLGNGSVIATIALPTGLAGMFSVATDGRGGTTLTLVHGTSDAVTIATRSDVAANHYGVSGAGITVGIISDSFNAQGGLYQDVANHALPSSTLASFDPTADSRSGTDEGRAMAQIVHDIAPNATLKFATADGIHGLDQDLATAINTLVAAGCNVIVDDIGEDPGAFYSLPTATTAAIKAATEAGIVMVTSATNRGNVFYEHAVQVVSGMLAGSATADNIYNFGTAASPQFYQKITIQDGYTTYLNLQSLALSGTFNMTAHFFSRNGDSYTALDVKSVASDEGARFQLPETGTSGTTDIYVAFTADTDTPDGIFKYTVAPASEPLATIDASDASVGSGSITGHQLDPNEITVAAADYRGTLPGKTLTIEDFSSSGPGALYSSAGNTLTPQAKPDITAPEHTSTTVTAPTATLVDGVGGLSTFSGTSAAAPAFAGVAALMLEADSNLTGSDIRNLTADSAISMGDRSLAGAGLVQADRAVGYARTHLITQFDGGNTTLLGTAGNDTLVTNSGNTTVSGGGGDDTVSAGGQSTSVMGGLGTLLLTVTSGTVSLSGGTGSVTVTGGAAGGTFTGGSNGHNVMTGHGNATIAGGGSGDLLTGGGGDLLLAASGNTTLVGSIGDVLVDAAGSLSFVGQKNVLFGAEAGGTDTVVGGSSDFTAVGRGGDTTVFGGAGNAAVWTGHSNVTDVTGAGTGALVAGSGTSAFWIGTEAGEQDVLALSGQGGGSVTVVGFRAGFDRFDAIGYGNSQPESSVSGGSLTLTLSDHTSVTFLGVSSLV